MENSYKTLIKLKTYNPIVINNKIASTHYSTIRKKFNIGIKLNNAIFKNLKSIYIHKYIRFFLSQNLI
jgi:hypothetical protein